MKKKVFWIGVAVLVIGVVLLSYVYLAIQYFTIVPGIPIQVCRLDPQFRQERDLALILQPLGIGLLVLGIIMIGYSVFVKQ